MKPVLSSMNLTTSGKIYQMNNANNYYGSVVLHNCIANTLCKLKLTLLKFMFEFTKFYCNI